MYDFLYHEMASCLNQIYVRTVHEAEGQQFNKVLVLHTPARSDNVSTILYDESYLYVAASRAINECDFFIANRTIKITSMNEFKPMFEANKSNNTV
mmetsp:Transcript_21296/g.26201  ORF Transcript_21296/g.26201 Transcript_21296/m.26201 type:complete len:96 (+) Transcript_21296:34-321(+)